MSSPVGAWNGEGRLDGAAHRLMDLARVAKADLDLGRVDVHVDALGSDVDEQQVGRLACAMQHVLVGGAHTVGDQLVADVAAVDVDVLVVGAGTRRFGRSGAPRKPQNAEVERDRTAGDEEIGAEDVGDAPFGVAGPPLRRDAAVVPDLEADVGTGQRVAPHGLHAMGELGGLGLEELAPRGRVEEQLADLDAGADGARRGAQFAAAGVEPDARGRRRRVRLVRARSATEAMAASASPRKPIVSTPSRSSRDAILLVA